MYGCGYNHAGKLSQLWRCQKKMAERLLKKVQEPAEKVAERHPSSKKGAETRAVHRLKRWRNAVQNPKQVAERLSAAFSLK